jgi:signal transduction histidine kinase
LWSSLITVTGALHQGGGTTFEVIDNGQGVPSDGNDRLFQRFHQGIQRLLTGTGDSDSRSQAARRQEGR